MEKSEKSRNKDTQKSKGKIWKDVKVPYAQRKTGSGVTFGGSYVNKEGD